MHIDIPISVDFMDNNTSKTCLITYIHQYSHDDITFHSVYRPMRILTIKKSWTPVKIVWVNSLPIFILHMIINF